MEKYASHYQRRKTEIDAFISMRNNAAGAILNAERLKGYEGAQTAYMSYLVGDVLDLNQQAAINRFDLLNDPIVSVEMRVDTLE